MCWIEGKAWRLRSPLRKWYMHFERDESWDKATESDQNREANVGPWWGKTFGQMLGKRRITLWPSFNVQTDSASSAPPRPPQNYMGDKVGRLLPILHTKLIAVSKEANGFALRNYDSWKETGRKRATQRGNSLTASMVFSPQNAAQSLARWGGENALSSGPRKNTSLRCLDSVSCTGYGNLSPLLVLFSSGEFLWSEKKIKMMQDWVLVSSCSTLWEVWKQMALGDYVDCSPKSNNVFRTQAATSATGTFWEAYPLSMKFLLCCMCFQIVHFRI